MFGRLSMRTNIKEPSFNVGKLLREEQYLGGLLWEDLCEKVALLTPGDIVQIYAPVSEGGSYFAEVVKIYPKHVLFKKGQTNFCLIYFDAANATIVQHKSERDLVNALSSMRDPLGYK